MRDSTPTRRAAFVAVREPTCVNKDASAHRHPPTAAARSSARLPTGSGNARKSSPTQKISQAVSRSPDRAGTGRYAIQRSQRAPVDLDSVAWRSEQKDCEWLYWDHTRRTLDCPGRYVTRRCARQSEKQPLATPTTSERLRGGRETGPIALGRPIRRLDRYAHRLSAELTSS